MRSLTAIILLTAFFALQYGKLVSYWHCRIVAVSSRCACEKILVDKHDTTAIAANSKIEQIVEFYEADATLATIPFRVTHSSFYTDYLPKLYTSAIFQPPRI